MTNETATGVSIKADRDFHAAIRTTNIIMKMLEDFIPSHSVPEARETLIRNALEQGFELTSKTMRKEYEAWKETQLSMLRGPVGPPPIEPDTRPTVVITRAMRG